MVVENSNCAKRQKTSITTNCFDKLNDDVWGVLLDHQLVYDLLNLKKSCRSVAAVVENYLRHRYNRIRQENAARVKRLPYCFTDLGGILNFDDKAYEFTDPFNMPVHLSAPRTSLLDLPGPVSQICMGFEHTIVLTKDGKVFAKGSNIFGQIGNEYINSCGLHRIQALENLEIKFIATGTYDSIVISTDGDAYYCGGQESTCPMAKIEGLPTRAISAAISSGLILILGNDGQVYYHVDEEIGVLSFKRAYFSKRVIAMEIDDNNTCSFVTEDGTLLYSHYEYESLEEGTLNESKIPTEAFPIVQILYSDKRFLFLSESGNIYELKNDVWRLFHVPSLEDPIETVGTNYKDRLYISTTSNKFQVLLLSEKGRFNMNDEERDEETEICFEIIEQNLPK